MSQEKKTLLILGHLGDDEVQLSDRYEIVDITHTSPQALVSISLYLPDIIIAANHYNLLDIIVYINSKPEYHPNLYMINAQELRDLAAYANKNFTTINMQENLYGIAEYLIRMGVPTNCKGFAALQYALYETMKNLEISMTKQLYPLISNYCGISNKAVERNIRNALQKCKQVNTELFQTVFGDVPTQKITNAFFIIKCSKELVGGSANTSLFPHHHPMSHMRLKQTFDSPDIRYLASMLKDLE